MSDLWFIGHVEPSSNNGFVSPDPVTLGDTSWTWDLEFMTNSNQWTYAKSTLCGHYFIGADTFWIFSGIVAYRTRGSNNIDTLHPVGQGTVDGVVDFINDTSVDSVTFGWAIGSDAYNSGASINFEVWVTG